MTSSLDIPRVMLPKTDAGNDPGDYKDDVGITAQLKADVSTAAMKAIKARTDGSAVVGALMQNPTEDNVALAFVERHEGDFVYLHGTGKWFRWIGTHWGPDVKGTVFCTSSDLMGPLDPISKRHFSASYFSSLAR